MCKLGSMSKSNNKNNKKKLNKQQLAMFYEMLKKTLGEMVSDLNRISPGTAETLQTAMSSSENPISDLQNKDSALCKAIPKSLLEADESGRKYLKILSVVQPEFKVVRPVSSPGPIPVLTTTIEKATTIVQPTAPVAGVARERRAKPVKPAMPDLSSIFSTLGPLMSSLPATLAAPIPVPENIPPTGRTTQPDKKLEDKLKTMMEGEDTANLKKLANEIQKDMNLEEKIKTDMGPQEMLGVMFDMMKVVQEKINTEELDVEQVQKEALGFCTQMQESPEFKETMESNPQLLALMNMGMAAGGDGGGENNMGALLGMLRMGGSSA
jgi:hypothetical protein